MHIPGPQLKQLPSEQSGKVVSLFALSSAIGASGGFAGRGFAATAFEPPQPSSGVLSTSKTVNRRGNKYDMSRLSVVRSLTYVIRVSGAPRQRAPVLGVRQATDRPLVDPHLDWALAALVPAPKGTAQCGFGLQG
jgi:hypothetical protein